MFKFLAYTSFTALVGAVSFAAATYGANELCKDNHGHGILPDA